jgi:hypothetical protein
VCLSKFYPVVSVPSKASFSVDKMFLWTMRHKVLKLSLPRERKSLERYSPETRVKIWVGHGWALSVRCISALLAVVCLHGGWNFRWIPTERTVDLSSTECFISATSWKMGARWRSG